MHRLREARAKPGLQGNESLKRTYPERLRERELAVMAERASIADATHNLCLLADARREIRRLRRALREIAGANKPCVRAVILTDVCGCSRCIATRALGGKK